LRDNALDAIAAIERLGDEVASGSQEGGGRKPAAQ